MLDSTTKRRIDDCRDILVGKVPDPKSQIEQITVALIYKFMHDMDQQAIELGGKASFFAKRKVKVMISGKEEEEEKDYAQYAWPELFKNDLSGEDRVKLYRNALESMEENPGLPVLFRDIFKNTYLPYNDPATLREFLKRINEFSYDHSEKLGDAFEYLLSIMGSQGDAGQFRTPRHLIDFMTAVLAPEKQETILDPACGTAGFLISAYKYILKHNSSNHTADDPLAFELHGVKQEDLTVSAKKYAGDKITPDQRKKLVKNIVGYDISPDMVRLSLVNLYLHGFPEPHIYEYDTLTSDERWEERFDVILANPPFMSPKGGIKPHGKFGIPSTRSEVLFVDYMAEHLNANGRAMIVVPEGIIFQSGKAYKALRKKLVDEKYLVGVISLPGGMFNPYSGVKTSLLWFDRALAKKTDKILFVKVEADGFDLGAQRRPIAQNDLPDAFRLLLDYKAALADGTEWKAPTGWEVKAASVERERIKENADYSLSGDRYLLTVSASSEWPMVTLDEVSDLITKGTTPTSVGYGFVEKGVAFVKVESLDQGGTVIPEKLAHITEECHQVLGRSQLKAGDVLFSIAGTLGRVGIVPESVLPANTNQALAIIRPKSVLNPRFAMLCLSNVDLQTELLSKKSGVAQYNLSLKQIGEVLIPLPPLPEQEAIVAEVEGYQKVIDGARQVVAHYRPRITIDPKWPIVELQEVSRFIDYRGKTPTKTEHGIPLITAKNVKKGFIEREPREYIAAADYDDWMTRGIPSKGDVLFTTEAPLGNVAQLDLDGKVAFAQRLIVMVPDRKVLVDGYLMYVLLSEHMQSVITSHQTGSTVFGIKASTLRTIKIPLPPLSEQQRIVAELEEERALVAASKVLVEKMEAKVRERVARVWGSGSDDQTIRRSDKGVAATTQALRLAEAEGFAYEEPELELALAAEPMGALGLQTMVRRLRGRPPKNGKLTSTAERAIGEYLKDHPGWHAKGEVLAATEIHDSEWTGAIKSLLKKEQVEQQGEKKGAKYRVPAR